MTHATVTASLHTVLTALADPVRLEMVRRLHRERRPLACGELYDGVTKATASHHFKVLREAGLTRRDDLGATARQLLLIDEANAAYPGLLEAVLRAAEREAAEPGATSPATPARE
ncbi:helix-turn-helix transcriptional regulator [Tsukamurella asaccharolytica]|uniref:Helix-turn-helix transcriptional regulator n=1 Tax=Tsukamurella asaccharolytica TaxID=2592067 RepID=A0A5C5REG1_9ACTN|nr:helix-turn-helix domain-containing protein [Tsukamurella asaccharolytica]TWS21499.1 helix-turn-helix transcriptional regulator [Tsukamurella asaccharolytica]